MKLKMKTLPVLIAGSVALLAASVGAIYAGSHAGLSARDAALVEEGRQVFRYDTFGDEIKWTDQLRMNEVIKIGRAHVCTPVTNAHLVCRLLLEKKHTRPQQHTPRHTTKT